MNQENGLLGNCQLALNSHGGTGKEPPSAPHFSNKAGQRPEQRASQESAEVLHFGCEGSELGTANYDLEQSAELPEVSDHKLCKRMTGEHRKLKVCLHLLPGVFSQVSLKSPVQQNGGGDLI